jgi:PIN domain nuclease of toxin-antitoxin system
MDPSAVADTSALLAYVLDEPGAEVVEAALSSGLAINLVNWADMLTVLVRRGASADAVRQSMQDGGILGVNGLLTILPVTEEDARRCAELYPVVANRGLSMGDRFCLATGLRLNLPVLTAERAWSDLSLIGLFLRQVRPA